MNVTLKKYADEYKDETIKRIAKFFGFHIGLSRNEAITEIDAQTAEENLSNWLSKDSELYLIFSQDTSVGFLRIGYRGDNVAWIEDVFVDEEYRHQGIATESIRQAERVIAQNPQYTAVCLDVVPKNKSALHLYYQLGYDRLSMITIRKELNDNQNNAVEEKILGYNFKV